MLCSVLHRACVCCGDGAALGHSHCAGTILCLLSSPLAGLSRAHVLEVQVNGGDVAAKVDFGKGCVARAARWCCASP
jgi:hypothetical protein